MIKENKKIKIGLPRAMHYHKYHVAWEEFFDQMGYDVVVSPETNQQILKRGVNLAVDESCLSLKLYLGHVDWLMDEVDYIFLPRIVALNKNERMCTKFMAMNDIVRNTFPNIKLIEYTIDVKVLKFEVVGAIYAMLKLQNNPVKTLRAYSAANKKQKRWKEDKLKSQKETVANKNQTRPMLLVVSHPYTTYDALLGKPITKFLESQGVDILYADVSESNSSRKLSENISKDLYWTYNKELIGSIENLKGHIDGIIFLMVFPCGPDALVINLCQNKIKDIPISVITLDELSGEAGLKTRLESFVDILKIKEK